MPTRPLLLRIYRVTRQPLLSFLWTVFLLSVFFWLLGGVLFCAKTPDIGNYGMQATMQMRGGKNTQAINTTGILMVNGLILRLVAANASLVTTNAFADAEFDGKKGSDQGAWEQWSQEQNPLEQKEADLKAAASGSAHNMSGVPAGNNQETRGPEASRIGIMGRDIRSREVQEDGSGISGLGGRGGVDRHSTYATPKPSTTDIHMDLDRLKTDLNIKPPQEDAWNRFFTAAIAQDAPIDADSGGKYSVKDTDGDITILVQRMADKAGVLKSRTDLLNKALHGLVKVLSKKQKHKLDESFRLSLSQILFSTLDQIP